MSETNIRVLDRPTTDEALKHRLVEMVRALLAGAENDEFSGLVVVAIRGDGCFKVLKAGTIRRLETVGYLAQAQHDLLGAEDETP